MSNLAKLPENQSNGTLQVRSMDDLARMSKMMADSGFFNDCQSAAQAGAKIMAGMEIGVSAFAALSGIHIIKGKAAIGANIMASKIKASGKYNYRVREHSDQVCRIEFFERFNGQWESIGVSEFTAADATKLGTQNMNKFPKNMLFARALSNGCKWFTPDVFLGSPVYTPDELGMQVDEDGEAVLVSSAVVENEATPQFVNQQQIKRMMAIANNAGYTAASIKAYALSRGFSSRNHVTTDVYEEMCGDLGDSSLAEYWNAVTSPESTEVSTEAVTA